MVQDLATEWSQSYPYKTKTSQETKKNLMKFLEPTRKPKVIYTDNSLEFGKSCEEFSWNHCTSTPHRSETNGIAERSVRRVKGVTSAVLCSPVWETNGGRIPWKVSCCYLRNIQEKLSDGKTPYERRFGMLFNGPVTPFGANGRISPYFCEGQVATASVRFKSLTRYIRRLCIVRGVNLERRHYGRGH